MAGSNYINEIWKPIPEFDRYEASSLGRIRTVTSIREQRSKYGKIFHQRLNGIEVRPFIGTHGYLIVNVNGRRVSVSRLVCAAFQGPANGLHCAHLDGDRKNNRADNLKWATPKENHSHKWQHGTMLVGEQCNTVKLTSEKVREIRAARRGGETLRAIASTYGITSGNVEAITKRRTWKHVSD